MVSCLFTNWGIICVQPRSSGDQAVEQLSEAAGFTATFLNSWEGGGI